MTKQEAKKKDVAKEEFLNKLFTLLEMLRPMSQKMMAHHDLSSKPIREIKRLAHPTAELLTFCESNRSLRTIRSLEKKIRPIILFQKGPFREEIFRIEGNSILFEGKVLEHSAIIETINDLKHYQEVVAYGSVKVDHNFSTKHRHYHQLTSYVRASIIDVAGQLDQIYEKETKPSRWNFSKKKK
jgi:hypothetical protein